LGPILIALALPLAEIAGFVFVGGWIGVWRVLVLVLLSGIAGALLLRAAGPQAMADLRRAAAMGDDPGRPMVAAAMRMMAAVLLIIPGFVTDVLALILLLPPVQAVAASRVSAGGAALCNSGPGRRAARRPRHRRGLRRSGRRTAATSVTLDGTLSGIERAGPGC
jgi:UPF0716 protein FxsA